jgi:hypothetical protein
MPHCIFSQNARGDVRADVVEGAAMALASLSVVETESIQLTLSFCGKQVHPRCPVPFALQFNPYCWFFLPHGPFSQHIFSAGDAAGCTLHVASSGVNENNNNNSKVGVSSRGKGKGRGKGRKWEKSRSSSRKALSSCSVGNNASEEVWTLHVLSGWAVDMLDVGEQLAAALMPQAQLCDGSHICMLLQVMMYDSLCASI